MMFRKMVLVVGMVLAGVVVQGRAETAPGKDLREFYTMNCMGCHGADGSARDTNGKRLRGTDFTDAAWQKNAKDAKMVKVILKGVFFGWGMPAFKNQLTPAEAQLLLTEVLRTSKKGVVIAPETKASSPAK
jgi:mono/diheme cytochrome c family protein